jgi:hypothetical protein
LLLLLSGFVYFLAKNKESWDLHRLSKNQGFGQLLLGRWGDKKETHLIISLCFPALLTLSFFLDPVNSKG